MSNIYKRIIGGENSESSDYKIVLESESESISNFLLESGTQIQFQIIKFVVVLSLKRFVLSTGVENQ